MTRLRAPLLLTALFALFGCKAGAAGRFIEPDKPSVDAAMGELECSEDQKRAEPLIVDWSSDDRTDLEVAMRDGIVVASYDCNSFRVLENCKATGGYSFAGVGRKHDVVQIVGMDELHANFPLGKANFTAALDRGSTIDVALVTVGKHRTSAFQVAQADIQGDCEGAATGPRARSSAAGSRSARTADRPASVCRTPRPARTSRSPTPARPARRSSSRADPGSSEPVTSRPSATNEARA